MWPWAISSLTEFGHRSWSFLVWRKKPKGTANCAKAYAHLSLTEGNLPAHPCSTTHHTGSGFLRVLLAHPFLTAASAGRSGNQGSIQTSPSLAAQP